MSLLGKLLSTMIGRKLFSVEIIKKLVICLSINKHIDIDKDKNKTQVIDGNWSLCRFCVFCFNTVKGRQRHESRDHETDEEVVQQHISTYTVLLDRKYSSNVQTDIWNHPLQFYNQQHWTIIIMIFIQTYELGMNQSVLLICTYPCLVCCSWLP